MIAPLRRSLLHVVGYADRGGCERSCEVFIRHCREFDHQVVVLGTAGPMSAIWAELGAAVLHLDVLAKGWVPFRAGLRAALQGSNFSGAIVWAGIRVPLVMGALASLRRPVVLHAGNPFAGSARVRLLLRAGRLLPRPRDLVVIGCSVHVARSFRQAPYFGRLPIESCLNPVEIPPANPHRPRPLDPRTPVRIGMVARLDPIKDHPTLLRAFGHLRASWPKAELHLAGEGPRRGALETLAGGLGLGDAVRFHGAVAAIPEFLGRLDLFAYFTTAHEGMGNALAEALAHGLPCVVSDLEVMREVGGEGAEGAVRFSASDPRAAARTMSELLRQTAGRAALSARAYTRAALRFSPRRAVERYLALLGAAL